MSNLSISMDDILSAADQIQGEAVRTPLIENQLLNDLVGGRVFIKPECLQRTGSFKFRGAYNRISRLSDAEKEKGVVAFSSGNHAQGVAAAAKLLGVEATIIMPADAPAIKMQNTKDYGAKVITYDRFTENREAIAGKIAQEKGSVVVPSFDDVYIMSGQGTVGLEIAEDLKSLGVTPDQILINCGGGGLSSGSFLALKDSFPAFDGYVVEPNNFDDTKKSLETGERQFIEKGHSSICDALLTDAPGQLTLEVLQDKGIKGIAVSDDEARAAVSYAARILKLVGEPGGVVSLAAVLSGKVDVKGKNTVCVISGGNIDPEMLSECLSH